MAAKELLECLLFRCGQSARDSEALLRSPLASPLGIRADRIQTDQTRIAS